MSEFVVVGKFDGKEIKTETKQLTKGMKNIEGGAVKLTKGFAKVGASIASAFAVTAIFQFGKKVAETRGEFQKLGAVLENTLGSKSAGQQAFRVLNQLAQKSNFGLLELTDSYVKLVNRGIHPTRQEMVQLQDLANSTGKSFDQLAEAALDAMTGENERLKEFGILAKKNGDTTKFTFKGVTTEVENTDEAIKSYLFSLGKLEGVTGSTEKISATFAGKISNIGDAIDNLLNNLGSGGGESILGDILDGIINGINWLGDSIEELQPTIQEFYDGTTKAIRDIANWFIDLSNESIFFRGIINTVIATVKTLWDATKLVTENIKIAFGTLGDVIKGVFTLDWDLVKQGLSQGFNDLASSFQEFGKNAAENYVGAFRDTIDGKVSESGSIFSSKSKEEVAEDFMPVSQIKANAVKVAAIVRKAGKVTVKEAKTVESAVLDVEESKRAQTLATNAFQAKSLKGFFKASMQSLIAEATAYLIKDAVAKFGWLGIPLAATAGQAVNGLFGALDKFADGGVIGGNSFSGDRQMILANSGERVINIPQQEFLLKAGGMNNEKMDVLIAQNEQIIDALVFQDRQTVNTTISSIALVDLYNDGTKNKGLLSSG